MDGGKDEVSGLCRGECDLHGRAIAHFTDEDDLGSLAEGRAQTAWEIVKISSELALIESRAFVFMDELDGIFQRHNVHRVLVVNLIEHRRERSRLAAARGAGNEDEPVLLPAHIFKDRLKSERREGRHLVLHLAHDDRDVPPLAKDIHAKAHAIRHGIAAIASTADNQLTQQPPIGADDIQGNALCLIRRQRVDARGNLCRF
jgi:hypothetical protein